MAAIWGLPLVVFVENNHYGISVPAEEVVAGTGIAERAAAYGAWGKRVDGTDVEVVASAFAEAVEHARAGNGPSLLEATCHRFRGHYEGDVDHYRSEAHKREMLERGDPLKISRTRLLDRGEADEEDLARIERETRDEVARVHRIVREAASPDPGDARRDVFSGTGR